MLCGTVTACDRTTGLGAVTADDGVEYAFHVVEIVDGSRHVEPGRRVVFQPLAKFGRFQAAGIRPV